MSNLLETDKATINPGRAKSVTPTSRFSILDQMVIYMLDNVGREGAVTINDMAREGFTPSQIDKHAAEAATIARRRFVRQVERA